MPCCQGFEVKNYDFTLGRLAYESLRLVQDLKVKRDINALLNCREVIVDISLTKDFLSAIVCVCLRLNKSLCVSVSSVREKKTCFGGYV